VPIQGDGCGLCCGEHAFTVLDQNTRVEPVGSKQYDH